MPTSSSAKIGSIQVGEGAPLVLIAGPCVIESRDHSLRLGERIAEIARRVGVPYVFKASFDKANRSSIHSFRGPGLDDGLATLAAVREALGVPVLSDVHEPNQCAAAGQVLDCLQIPAFLCRQTDLLVAAARSGRCVNVKKGQFLGPEKMRLAAQKERESGCEHVLLTERGTSIGYERLVNHFTELPIMRQYAPVVFDATHSVQRPGTGGDVTGGAREFIPPLCRAAMAVGVDALFMEVHDDPDNAKSDAANVWPLDELESLLVTCVRVREAAQSGAMSS